MSSSDFTQRRPQEHQVQAAAVAEEEQHGSHGHGKDERAEAADKMLDRLLDEMNTPGRGQGEKSGTRPPDSTRRSSMEREVGEGVKALTGAGEKEAQKRVVAVQAAVVKEKSPGPRNQPPWKKSQGQCHCHPNNLLDLKWYKERGKVDCYLPE